MKTYTLTVPDDATEAAVRAALAELLARNLIGFEPEDDQLFDPWHTRAPASARELDERIAEADGQPRLSFAEARQRLGL